MSNPPIPTPHAVRGLAFEYGIDPRTLVKAIRGEEIKGAAVAQAAAKAVAVWRKQQARKPKSKRAA